MGEDYGQLNLEERIEIYRLHAAGKSRRSIATGLGRSASTISRELRRNRVRTKAWPGGYEPVRAHHLAERRRRWDCRFKLKRLLSLSKGRPARPGERRPCDGMVSRTDRRPVDAGKWSHPHQSRVNLSLHLSPLCTEGLLASPVAAGQAQARSSWPFRWQHGRYHQASAPFERAPCRGSGPAKARALGSRLHALCPIWPVHPGRP